MKLRATHPVMLGRFLGGLLVAMLMPVLAIADTPIASSSFVGAEDPLSENGAWAAITSLAPQGTRFQKNDGAYPDLFLNLNHAGARTTAVLPDDHYSEIVVGHIGINFGPNDCCNDVGPLVRVQASGPAIDSHYLWWAGANLNHCCNNALYRVDANGTTYSVNQIKKTSPVVDGDRLRLIARGQVIYGIKNGVRDFIYNTGPDSTKYSTGTAGMLAYASSAVTDAKIASWASGAAPVSLGTWTSSTFAGTENPLDEGDRWYPLPGYSGFKKMGGLAIGLDSVHNASGVWSITPPAKQYSEVTLGSVASGGGGPIVRIDRSNPGQTGWLLFLWADNPFASGIYKMTPDGSFTPVRLFTATIVSGDKWRLTANGNTLDVFRNGVFQFTYTTDGSYATGDVGIEAFTPNFTFMGWEGGDPAGGTPDTTPPTAPSNLTATAASSSQINLAWTASTDDVGVAGYLVERCQGSGCTGFAQVATVAGTTYNDTGLVAATSYSYRVRATDAAGNLSGYSITASATTLAGAPTTPPTAPSNLTATAASSSQINLAWTASTDDVGVAGYLVERCQGRGCTGFAQVATVAGTTYNDTGLVAATSYSYRVRATDAAGNLSGYSNTASATTLAGAPTITSFTPSSGPVGTSVTIGGTSFTGATAVRFNGVSTSFTVISDTAIQATVPTGATTGPLSVTTPGGTATSPNNFTVTVTLTVTKTGIIGSGTVTSSDGGTNCGATCSASYNSGTVVTLTATPTGLLSIFTGWDGCDTASGTTCTVIMTRARAVTAHFLP